jgi:senataxin
MWSGKTLDLIWTELKNITGMSPKPRILVCAPSNAAVDEIVERLQLLKLLDGDLNKYDAEMVRVGNADRIRDAVNAQLSLDSQVDAFLSMNPDVQLYFYPAILFHFSF